MAKFPFQKVCICGGLLFGAGWGLLIKHFPEKGDAYVIPLRTLMLFAGGVLAVIGSEHIGYEGAGPLAVVFAAFIGYFFYSNNLLFDEEQNEFRLVRGRKKILML